MAQYVFGAGAAIATPLTDASGLAVAVPTPVKFQTLQDITIDMSHDIKMLHGAFQWAESVGRGKGKASVKIKNGRVNGAMYNSVFFGQSLATGQDNYYQDIAGVAIPAAPYSFAPTPAGAGIWSADMGVRNASGAPMTRVASAPATGQYALLSAASGTATFATNVMTVVTGTFVIGQTIVSAGLTAGTKIISGTSPTFTLSTAPGTITPAQAVTALAGYIFAAADTGLTVYADYKYSVTTGTKIVVANQVMGSAPVVSLDIVVPFQGKQATFRFGKAIAGKLSMATKLDDYAIPEMDFDCFVDDNGQICTMSMAE